MQQYICRYANARFDRTIIPPLSIKMLNKISAVVQLFSLSVNHHGSLRPYKQYVTILHNYRIVLRASCLTLEIKEFRRYEVKIEESEKSPAATGGQTQDTSDLSRQCSATELWQPDNHQPPSILPQCWK